MAKNININIIFHYLKLI